jgi:hypothetical protein
MRLGGGAEEDGEFTLEMRVELHYTARLGRNLTSICRNYLQKKLREKSGKVQVYSNSEFQNEFFTTALHYAMHSIASAFRWMFKYAFKNNLFSGC